MAIKHENAKRKEIRAFLEKIVIDAGVGRLGQTPNFEDKTLVQVTRDLANMTGQKPELRRAKKSIAGFKLREGKIVGLRTTLRRDKMVDFFERLITIVLPRVRDFSGLDHKAIDQGGTLNVGIREHQVFPEIAPEASPVSFSLGVSIVPKVKNREKAFAEFMKLGVPMKKEVPAKKKK
jgi:large subunit ribosomal protein L5